LLEQAVVEAYCSLGSQECIAKFKNIFGTQVLQKCQSKDAVASQCSTVAAPLRAKTYCYGVREGGESAFNKVKELYKVETVHIEKNILRDALACYNDVVALKELMLLALDRNSSFVRLQDVKSVFTSVSKNPLGAEIILNFLLERWEHIYEGLMPERRSITAIIETAAVTARSQYQIEQAYCGAFNLIDV
ncbi:unnamed protein product, partial [Strongylus vulgaris]